MGEAAVWDDNEIPMELINGKIVMMSPRPGLDHTRVSGAIYRIFSNALEGKRCEAFPDGVDLYLDEKNHFVPDGMIVCDPSQSKYDRVVGAPSLVVEVLSPSTASRDRGDKFDAYGKAGVQEYWIVDILGRSIDVYRQKDGRLVMNHVYQYFSPEGLAENAGREEHFRLHPEDTEQVITVDLCGGFKVPLAKIFARVLYGSFLYTHL